MDLVEDHRLEKPELCRATTMLGPHEFICIRKVHAPEVKPGDKVRAAFDVRGKPANWAKHHYVRRYPIGNH